MDKENVCEFNPNEDTPHTVHVKDLPQGSHFIILDTVRHIDDEEPVIPVNMEFGVYSIFNPSDKWHQIFKTRKENKICGSQKH